MTYSLVEKRRRIVKVSKKGRSLFIYFQGHRISIGQIKMKPYSKIKYKSE